MASSDYVTLPVDDGSSMRAFVARPTGRGPHRAMLVFQDAMGVNASLREIAGDFAAEGFVAVAPELFHRFAPGFETDTLDMTTLMGGFVNEHVMRWDAEPDRRPYTSALAPTD